MNVPHSERLTRKEIGSLVHNWIGVDSGYLGHFSYARHDRFWMELCDKYVNTSSYEGTTRACFEETLFEASAKEQGLALRAILEEYPSLDAADPARPKFRTPSFRQEIGNWISRLETGQVVVGIDLVSASEIVRRALDDADVLTRTSGPQSAVDRVHTAMHGYLKGLCDSAASNTLIARR